MNQARVVALIVLFACAFGCGGSAPRTEGPITSPWSAADDAALGMTPAGSTPEISTSGGDSARQ